VRILLRHLGIAAVPLACAIVASYGFARAQGSCGAMVGPILAAKCHGRQLEYQLLVQLAGTAFGSVIAAFIGARLESRRRRVVQPEASTQGDL
jgi:uncharacterized membrane protein YfcA